MKIEPIEFKTILQPGDVALIYGPRWTSTVLVAAQRALGLRAKFSHVLLNVTGDLWCQAMPGKGRGVEIVTTNEAFLTEANKPRCVAVMRPPRTDSYQVLSRSGRQVGDVSAALEAMASVSVTLDIRQNWLSAAMYYLGQRYNFGFLIPKLSRDTSKFCSELVAAVMKARGIEPFASRKSWSFAPAHLSFEMLRGKAGWTDVTQILDTYMNTTVVPPSPSAENEERERLIASYVMLTDSAAGLYKARASTIRIEVGLLSASLPVGSQERLLAKLSAGRKLLEGSEILGSMHRGAPWIGGSRGESGLLAAIEELRREIAEGEKHLRRAQRRTKE